MSTYYDLKCLDCNDVLDIHANHAAVQIQELIEAAPGIAALGKTHPHVLIDYKNTFSIYGERGGAVEAGWFAKHDGHRLTPFDEYGMVPTQCYKYVTCGECGSGLHCSKDRDHEDPCQMQRK